MADILQQFIIHAPILRVFDAITIPAQLNCWWPLESSGEPKLGAEYRLFFGEPYDWRAVVSRCTPPHLFEWQMTHTPPSPAMDDWLPTRVGFALREKDGSTTVDFYHAGWPHTLDHYRISGYCWAQLLRLLKRYCEAGEVLPHAQRSLL